MIIRYFGRTISGRPGRSVACNRNRKPSLWRAFLTSISGFVFVDRIRAMFAERAAVVLSFGDAISGFGLPYYLILLSVERTRIQKHGLNGVASGPVEMGSARLWQQ